VALLVIAVVVVLIAVTSGGSNTSARNPAASSRTTNAPVPGAQPAASAFSPSKVTVAVLNGTSTSGLAHRIALQLTQLGYRPGPAVTAPDQTRTATIVAYTAGNRDAALHVASALKRGSASVQPIDAATQAVACPPPATCAAQVVVTVGADLATGA
jgi:hypothetical protein